MEKIEDIFNVKEDYKKIITAGKPWTDPNFSKGTAATKGISSNCRWLRASEIFHGKEKIFDSFSGDDIVQGSLGDCYLLSAISALAEFPGRVQKLFVLTEKNAAGCYVVRLCICGKPMEIVMDDYFALEGNELLFAGTAHNELWAMLIEKAWAKIHGGYPAIEGGDARESLAALTGAPVEFHKHSEMSVDELWKIIKEADNANYVMCTGAIADIKGIVRSHAYTLINAYEFEFKGQTLRLVQIRNPWGYGEWEGDWHDNDPKWTPELKRKLNHGPREDGIFYMSFNDFAKIFSHTLIAKANDNYVSSSLVVKGQKVFATFRVRRELKGFISAYQISRRLGSTLIKDYNIERVKLSIYKLAEDDLDRVSCCLSNPVGQVNIEVNLGPGIYVVKGEFDSDSKLPYVIFNSYAERRINFCQLPIKSLKDATMERAQEALKQLKTAYTTSRQKKAYKGEFRECLSGHVLEWSTNLSKTGLKFTCNNCKSAATTEEGRWSCDECSYEICTKCRPKRFRDIGDTKGITKIKCEKEHDMKFLPDKIKQETYLCDSCGKAYYGTVSRWKCEPCEIDLCRICMAAPHGFRSENEPLEIEVCPKNHTLELLVTDTVTRVYECYICTNMGNANDGRWGCLKCDINICPVCKPTGKIRRGYTMAKSMSVVCDRGHILMFGCSPPTSTIACKKCKKDITSNIWRWYCKRCNFNICAKCRPEPEGRRDILCANYHKLVYSDIVQGNVTYGRCHRCHKVFKLVDGRYCCFGCEYECCKKCAAIAEELKIDDSAIVEKGRKGLGLNDELLEEATTDSPSRAKENERSSDCMCVIL